MKITQQPLLRFINLIRQSSPKWSGIYAIFLFLNGIFPLFQLFIIKLVIDNIATNLQTDPGEGPLNNIFGWLIIAGFAYLVSNLLGNIEQLLSKIQTQFLTDYLQNIVHKKSISVDLQYYEDPLYHDTLHRAQQEARTRPSRLIASLSQLIKQSISLVVISVVLFALHWMIPIILVIASCPFVFSRIKLSQKLFSWNHEKTQMDRQSYYFSWIMTQAAYAKEMRLFGLGEYFSSHFNDLRSYLRRKHSKILTSRILIELPIQIVNSVVLIVILIYIVKSNYNGQLTLGDVVMYMQATIRTVSALVAMVGGLSGIIEHNLFIVNLFEFLNIDNKIKNSKQAHKLPSRLQQGIELNDVSFRYPGFDQDVINGISLRIDLGEIIGLTGLNGAGKTTLTKLICRFYDPSSGTVKINGMNIKEIDVENLRANISVLFQDYARYYLTFRENVHLGDISSDFNVGRFESSLVLSAADKLRQNLQNGDDQILGNWFENGTELSFGQWQRIALARALYRQAPITILDEPTNAQDVESRIRISETIIKPVPDQILIVITHDQEILKRIGRVIKLENGKLIDESHSEDLQE